MNLALRIIKWGYNFDVLAERGNGIKMNKT